MSLPQSAYATIAQIQILSITQAQTTRFGVPAMTAAIQAASSICDSYIASQFQLPLITSPIGWDMSLVMATCAIAAYILNNQAGYNPGAPIDETIKTR
jgi:phage gp36-like protein